MTEAATISYFLWLHTTKEISDHHLARCLGSPAEGCYNIHTACAHLSGMDKPLTAFLVLYLRSFEVSRGQDINSVLIALLSACDGSI